MPGNFNFDRAKTKPNFHAEKWQRRTRRLGYDLRSARSQYAYIPGVPNSSTNTAFIPGTPLNQNPGSGGVVKYPTTYEPDPDSTISPKPTQNNSPVVNTYGLKVFSFTDDNDEAAGVPSDPNDLQIKYDQGTPESVTPFGSTTLADANKLCYPTELPLNTSFDYTVILPEDSSLYKYTLLVNQPVYDLADGTVNVNTVGRETTFTITPTSGGKYFEMQYTYQQKGPVRTIQFSYYKCFYSANPSSNFLPPSSCLNSLIDKTGENIDLAYDTKENTKASSFAPMAMLEETWETSVTSNNRTGIHTREQENTFVYMTKGDNVSWVYFYLPIYIKDTNPNVRIYYSTDYAKLNNGATSLADRSGLSGSPQIWSWSICHDGGTINSPANGTYPINRSDIISRNLISEKPEVANLKGLYYVKVKAAVPNISSAAEPRSIEWDFLQAPLPVGWKMKMSRVQPTNWTVTGDTSGQFTLPGTAYSFVLGSEEYTFEVVLPGNIPEDKGRSSVLHITAGAVQVNWNTDLANTTDWKSIFTSHSTSGAFNAWSNVMIPRENYDITNNKVVFRLRKEGANTATVKGVAFLGT